jgi:alpha-tubulin suppressor-like RCC1 family protein
MKKNRIITPFVITVVMISTIVLYTNCKGRADKTGSDTAEIIADNISNEKAEQLPVDKKERESYPEIACGSATTILLKEDGTVWAWGSSRSGAIGNGTDTGSPSPVQVSGLTGVKAISAACDYNIALLPDGTVWSWGSNEYGGLGNGTKTNSNVPVQATGLTGVMAIAAGSDHTLALKSDGTVWIWGNNSFGQIGDGTKNNEYSKNDPENDQLTPVQVPGLTGVRAVAASRGHNLALKSDGTVWAWGRNDLGQLGDGTNQERFTPVQVLGPDGSNPLTDITMIAAGGFYGGNSAAVRNDGTLFLWGDNDNGQLGDGSDAGRLLPGAVTGLDSVKAVAVGGQHVIALKLDGTVWAWGYNNDYQLGFGSGDDQYRPVQVPELAGIRIIYAGGTHNVAIGEDRKVWIWGDDSSGQLGDGTMASRLSQY